jgi:hypothetical protein
VSKVRSGEDAKSLIDSYFPSGSVSVPGVGVTDALKHSLSLLLVDSRGLTKEQARNGDSLWP